MDESHFSVVVRLDSVLSTDSVKEDGSDIYKAEPGSQKGSLKISQGQPHPPPASLPPFDEVYPSSDSQEQDMYRHSVASLVNSVLEGFNGTVISLRNETQQESNFDRGLVIRAASHIFNTLKKLRKSGLANNLVVPCTFVMLSEEIVYDLFHEADLAMLTVDKERESKPVLELVGNILVNNSVTPEATKMSDVRKLLDHGEIMMGRYLKSHNGTSFCHTIFTIGVKYADFGALFSPISGTLSFVSVRKCDSLDVQGILTSKVPVTTSQKSVNDLIGTIHKLSEKAVPLSDESSHSSMPTSDTQDKSILTRLLEEALGGNCKTLLVCHVPTIIKSSLYHHCHSMLELASRARKIENKPDKTELAKKALMDAYMKELRKLYGESSKEENTLDEFTNDNKDAELAAKALASAVQSKESGSDSNNSDSEDESSLQKSGFKGHSHERGNITVRSRRFTLTKKSPVVDILESPSSSSFCQSSVNLTIEALVAVIQEPDKGVPRARTGSLEHVKIHRGKVAVFSGADIVSWLVKNVAGVESEEDAEQIGQILLDKEAIFHSEGSSVFANSSHLFYYARDSRPIVKPLTQEEILALLIHDKEQPQVQVLKVTDSHQQRGESSVKQHDVEQFFDIEATIRYDNNHTKGMNSCTDDSGDTTNTQSDNASMCNDNSPHTDIQMSEADDTCNSKSLESTLVASTYTTKDSAGFEESDNPQSLPSIEDDADIDDDDEIEETSSTEQVPNLKAIENVPDLQTLEKYSDYPHPLHFQAATSNQTGVIKHLIHWYGVDQLDERNRIPLMFAALGNKAGSCRALIEHGSLPDQRDKSGLTAVHIACYHGHKEALTVLVNKGANIGIRDRMLHTAFHWSVVPTSTHCLKIILRHSQKQSLEREQDKSGLTPVHWAIFYDHLEHLKLLLPRCTDLTRLDSCGRNFAIYSIQKENIQCLECLLRVCPKLAVCPDQHQLTSLHHASALPSAKYLRTIINTMQATAQNQLTLEVQDQYGRTPVHYAVLYGHCDVLNLLLTHGAHQCPRDNDGRSPLDLSKEFGIEDNEMIMKLLQSGPSEVAANLRPDCDSEGKQQSGICNLF